MAGRAGRDPQTRRAPSRRSVRVRPGHRAAGAADAARADDADGPATAHLRSSNRARSRATPNSRDALPASPPPSSGQSRNTAPAHSIAPGCDPQPAAGGCWACPVFGKQAGGTLLFEAAQQTKHLTPLQADQHTGVIDTQTTRLEPQQHVKKAELLLAH